jgi:acyl-CoA hydrolase
MASMSKIMTPGEAATLIRSIDSLGLGLGPANPHALLAALSERDDFEDLIVGGALILGLFDLFTKPGVHYRSGFFGPAERYLSSIGANVEFVPAGFRQFGPILEQMRPRVMAAQATAPDENGNVSLSLHLGATYEALIEAGRDPDRLLIIETSPHLPWTHPLDGYSNTIPLDLIDVLIEGSEAPYELPEPPSTEVDEAIANNALDLIVDGATLQTGIGGIPSKVATRLAERPGGGYGIHSEMLTDGIKKLYDAGKVTNANKGCFEGVSVTTFALGSASLYRWLDHNEDIAFAPVLVVNDPTVIAKNESFVSINGAICVDLYGQIVADNVNGRQISGVGGHEDFISGAELRLGDRSLVCLASTIDVDGETRSRILPTLEPGAIVSTPRHHTGVIVTEFGAADLAGLTVKERAHALVEVAHPEFRSELRAAADLLR